MTTIKLGCDPEGFLYHKKEGFIPAFGIVPGTKEEPHQLDGGAVQVDGLALEFNINPVETEDQFVGNIKKVLYQIDEMIKTVDKDINIVWIPVAEFRPRIWDMAPEQSKILGCDPDYNILGQVNPNPFMKLENQPIRTAAGHIHIGWLDKLIDEPVNDLAHFELCRDIAEGFHKAGLSTFVPTTSEERRRLEFYGHSGSFRPKKYGVELRAPSNRWVRNEESQREIFRQVRNTFNDLTGL